MAAPSVDPSLEWTEVPDTPFLGPYPERPTTRTVYDKDTGGRVEQPLHEQTIKWWDTMCRLPHARLWDEGDWNSRIETLMLVDLYYCGNFSRAPELRTRQNEIGMTREARQKLRIRYAPVDVPHVATPSRVATEEQVPSDISARRKMVQAWQQELSTPAV